MTAPVLTMGFRPSSHGFSWIAFSSPLAVHDWGQVEARRGKNERCLAKLDALLAQLTPETLVMEAFEGVKGVSERVTRLSRAVVALAQGMGIDVAFFGRDDIRACFVNVGARTRDEIAHAVARSFDILRPLLPERRRAWQSKQRRMPLFEAAAVVLTHYHFGASQLFDDLLSAHDIPPEPSS